MEDDSIVLDPLVGKSRALRELLSRLRRAAPMPFPLLLFGPYGAGFKHSAAYVHAHSGRNGPFVRLPCLALQEPLERSSLYAGPPALKLRLLPQYDTLEHIVNEMKYCLEKVRKADAGTLFLEELADLTPRSQALLESILDGSAFRRYFPEDAPPEFRVIASTNDVPERLVDEGRLRASLYHELCGATIRVPGLRERGYDVVLLARELLSRYPAPQERHFVLDESVEGYLFARSWAANVPELEKLIRHACCEATSDRITTRTLREVLDIPRTQPLPGYDHRLLETIGESRGITEEQLRVALGLPREFLSARLLALTKVGRLRRAGRGAESRYSLPRIESEKS